MDPEDLDDYPPSPPTGLPSAPTTAPSVGQEAGNTVNNPPPPPTVYPPPPPPQPSVGQKAGNTVTNPPSHPTVYPPPSPLPPSVGQEAGNTVNNPPIVIQYHFTGGTHPYLLPNPQMANASQPIYALPPAQQLHPWSTDLFGCCEDCASCWITCCLPAITFGEIAAAVHGSRNACLYCGALYCFLHLARSGWSLGWKYRARLRALLSIQGEPCEDCLIHCCFPGCALCQEYRELKNRGYYGKCDGQQNSTGVLVAVEGQQNSTGVPVGVEGQQNSPGVPVGVRVPPQVQRMTRDTITSLANWVLNMVAS